MEYMSGTPAHVDDHIINFPGRLQAVTEGRGPPLPHQQHDARMLPYEGNPVMGCRAALQV